MPKTSNKTRSPTEADIGREYARVTLLRLVHKDIARLSLWRWWVRCGKCGVEYETTGQALLTRKLRNSTGCKQCGKRLGAERVAKMWRDRLEAKRVSPPRLDTLDHGVPQRRTAKRMDESAPRRSLDPISLQMLVGRVL